MASLFDYSRVITFSCDELSFEKELKRRTLDSSRFDNTWEISSVSAIELHDKATGLPNGKFLFVVILKVY